LLHHHLGTSFLRNMKKQKVCQTCIKILHNFRV
jgi:hypothetical protein